jgi:uncharacterized protein (DUF2267 family)
MDIGYSLSGTAIKTSQILKDIETKLGWSRSRRAQTYTALRAVLHALRDTLTVFQADDLARALPVLIRGLYFEGWRPAKVPVEMDRDKFLARIQHDLNYQLDVGVETLVNNVVEVLRKYIAQGDIEESARLKNGLSPATT